ncbi:acyl-CoA thioesterase domain-containing protein [Parasphingorhabdus pacifica]
MTETDEAEAFFTPDGGHYRPTPPANSPWAPDMLHGRLLGGLLARAVEQGHAEPGLQCARLTVDLFRSTAMVPVRVETTRVRDGRRIRVADATVFAEERPVARASVVLLRRSEQPPGDVERTPRWEAPDPHELGAPPIRPGWQPPFDSWLLSSDGKPTEDWDTRGARRVWLRERHPLVEGETTSPVVRTALAADFASPLAHYGTRGLGFINADYNLTLSRPPDGDFIGIHSDGHISDDGIAAGQCTLHDPTGPIGFCATTAVANLPR